MFIRARGISVMGGLGSWAVTCCFASHGFFSSGVFLASGGTETELTTSGTTLGLRIDGGRCIVVSPPRCRGCRRNASSRQPQVLARDELALPVALAVAHVRRPRLDYELHAAGLDRNELGALLVAAGLGTPRRTRARLAAGPARGCGCPKRLAPTSTSWASSAGTGRWWSPARAARPSRYRWRRARQ